MLFDLEEWEVDVVTRDTFHRGNQVLERVLVEPGDDLRRDTAVTRSFVDDDASARLAHALDDWGGVHRPDRQQVDDLRVHAVHIHEVLDGLERGYTNLILAIPPVS